jgi:isoleucyl-tRNA synthetase
VSFNKDLDKDLLAIVLDELNVKEFKEKLSGKEKSDRNIELVLDIKITEGLKLEGIARDIIREIQQARKEARLSPGDQIKLYYKSSGKALEAINKFSKSNWSI